MNLDFTKQNRQLVLFKALANANRLKILKALDSAPSKQLNVTDLCKQLKMNAPKISDHLKLLRTNKIVKAKQTGSNMFYSIKDPAILVLLEVPV